MANFSVVHKFFRNVKNYIFKKSNLYYKLVFLFLVYIANTVLY